MPRDGTCERFQKGSSDQEKGGDPACAILSQAGRRYAILTDSTRSGNPCLVHEPEAFGIHQPTPATYPGFMLRPLLPEPRSEEQPAPTERETAGVAG